jgi:hypothetical protein
MRPEALPGWVIVPDSHGVRVRHAGQAVVHTRDLRAVLAALGRPTPTTERVAAAVAPWLGIPADDDRVLVATPRHRRAVLWRACLAALAAHHGYVPTARVERLLLCQAVWTYADEATLRPLWGTAATAGIPLVWVPYRRLAEGLPLMPTFRRLLA